MTASKEYPGNLFVVAAPSGAGKSSLVKALLELDSHVHPSISHTTRAPRGQEKHGREYFFASESESEAEEDDADELELWLQEHTSNNDETSNFRTITLEVEGKSSKTKREKLNTHRFLFLLPPIFSALLFLFSLFFSLL